jgi:hypothetical protein
MRLLASLLFCLLLSGCNEDQLILRFNVSVAGESGPGINATLERALRAALVSQQIDAQRIGVRRLDGDGLALSFSGAPLSAAERQRLQDYLGAILAARATWNERVRLELQMERLDAEYMALMPEGEVRERMLDQLALVQSSYDVGLTFDGLPGLGDEGRLCQVEAGLDAALPRLRFFFERSSPPKKLEALVQQALPTLIIRDTLVVPHVWHFADPDLQRLVTSKQVQVHLPERGGDRLGFAIPAQETDALAGCAEAMAALGRPFSLFYGAGMDRLVDVEYRWRD